jgi:Ca2+-transporting ATPase
VGDAHTAEALDAIGAIARVAPGDKVRLVRGLQRGGEVVAATGAGMEDAPELEAADVGIAIGPRATALGREVAPVIVTAEGLSTVVRALQLGRALYDDVLRCVRFQVGALAGLVLVFLGAAATNVADGIALLPLQTLYVSFTTVAFQSAALGAGKPDDPPAGMPRPLEPAIVPRSAYLWTALDGLVQALATVAVIAVAEHEYGTDTARTMGLVTFSAMTLLRSLYARTGFTVDVLAERTFMLSTAASLAAIVLGAQTGVLERMIGTTGLDFAQWLTCIGAAMAIVVTCEIRRAMRAGARDWPTQAPRVR